MLLSIDGLQCDQVSKPMSAAKFKCSFLACVWLAKKSSSKVTIYSPLIKVQESARLAVTKLIIVNNTYPHTRLINLIFFLWLTCVCRKHLLCPYQVSPSTNLVTNYYLNTNQKNKVCTWWLIFLVVLILLLLLLFWLFLYNSLPTPLPLSFWIL